MYIKIIKTDKIDKIHHNIVNIHINVGEFLKFKTNPI